MPTNRVVESDTDTPCDECGGGTEIVTHYMTGSDGDESTLMLVSGPTRRCANSTCPSRE
jgi:hypothetical protein